MSIFTTGARTVNPYNVVLEKRKSWWCSFFAEYENIDTSDDIAVTDLPKPLDPIRMTNNNYENTKNLSVTLNSSDDEMSDLDSNESDDVLDSNSEASSEDIAEFSESEDEEDEVENELLYQSKMKHNLVYESDEDDVDSEDIDPNDNNDFIDDFLDVLRKSKTDKNETNDASYEYSDRKREPVKIKKSCESRRKRTYSESELNNDDLEAKPQIKRKNNQFNTVDLYINTNETEFESDSE